VPRLGDGARCPNRRDGRWPLTLSPGIIYAEWEIVKTVSSFCEQEILKKKGEKMKKKEKRWKKVPLIMRSRGPITNCMPRSSARICVQWRWRRRNWGRSWAPLPPPPPHLFSAVLVGTSAKTALCTFMPSEEGSWVENPAPTLATPSYVEVRLPGRYLLALK